MFPVHTKTTRKGAGDVTRTFCPDSAVLHSAIPARAIPAHHELRAASPPVVGFAPGAMPVIADAGAMYTFAHDQGIASEELWVWFLACREIAAAIATLEEAGATLVALVDSSGWQSEGFRALHELIMRLRDDTGAEIGQLKVREWELGGGGGE